MGTPTLYHYTCQHGRHALGDGPAALMPGRMLTPAAWAARTEHLWLADLVWLTDLAEPNQSALGLTLRSIRCERWRHRYRVTDGTQAERWVGAVRRRYPREDVRELETQLGVRPAHWWVATDLVPVVYDPVGAS